MNRSFGLLLTFAAIISCTSQKDPEIVKEPIAKKVPKRLEIHGDTRVDNYYWMNDREDPEVIKYLEDENQYREFVMKGTETLQDSLFREMRGRIKEQDESVPVFKNGYYYYVRYDEGKEYPIYCRKAKSLEGVEEIMLDVNEMASGHEYYQVGGMAVSPNNRFLAFGVDTLSRRLYTIHIKDLETGEILADAIPNTTGGSSWANDDKTLFYTMKDLTTLRSYQIRRHVMGTTVSKDVIVFTEEDETFNCGVAKSKSMEFIIIGSGSTMSDEIRYIPADRPESELKVLQARIRGLEYDAEPYDGYWYIRTNQNGATNFKLARTPYENTGVEHWEDVIPHRDSVYLEGLEIFRDYLVVEERNNGLSRIRFRKWDEIEMHEIPFEEETYTCGFGPNPEFDTSWLRYGYSSLTTPNSTFEYNLATGETRLLKQQEVVGGYDPSEYHAERVWVTARDGKKVAISMVYRKDLKKANGNPLLLYGYGSYGYTVDPTFSSLRLSLLDRGFIFAIAHIRGGSYLGRPWYEDGKLLQKKNSFTVFIDCSELLIESGYTR
ncbi:MAG: prolyl oligopeptidase family serine peptidase [Bacteroidota bacterium]|nr:prolyl oligopeptidase family serine peptidase [Bacteroidota bacterium]